MRYLKGMIRAHLTVMEIENIEDELREKVEFLDPDPAERIKVGYAYPNLAQFKMDLSVLEEVRDHINHHQPPA